MLDQVEQDDFKRIRDESIVKLGQASGKKEGDKILGYFFEDLIILALKSLGCKTRRRRTRGLDVIADVNNDPSKRLAIEATNWKDQSNSRPDYFAEKTKAFATRQKASYECLWIMTYINNFPPIPAHVHTIETKKQFLPSTATFEDYMHLKKLITAKLAQIFP